MRSTVLALALCVSLPAFGASRSSPDVPATAAASDDSPPPSPPAAVAPDEGGPSTTPGPAGARSDGASAAVEPEALAERENGDGSLVIQAVGDLNIAGSAAPTVAAKGAAWCFDGTRALLATGDLNIANLETPVTTVVAPAKKKFTYRMPPSSLDAVKDAPFHVVSLANNHMLDQGAAGMFDTLRHLDARGIAYAGAGADVFAARRPAIVTVRGVKVGFLSYSLTFPKEFWATETTPGTVFGHERYVREDVSALRGQVDVVLVAFHWGAEKMQTPKDYQRELGRAAIEAGADAVIGHHPHVLQGVEVLDGRPILYSLGNYAFGSGSRAAKDAALARLVVEDGRLVRLELVPLNVLNAEVEFNPQVAEGERAAQILAHIDALSSALGTKAEIRDEKWVVDLAPAPRVVEAETP